MESVKKSIDERVQHKREYDNRVNERQIQTTEEKIDTSNALDASSVIIESNRTVSQKHDTSSRSGNDADIRPIYDEEPMAEVQMTANNNVSATGQQHTEQPEFNNEGEVDQNVDQCYDTRPLPAILTNNRTTELSNQLLESENVCLKKTVAQFKKKGFAIAALKNEFRKLTGNSVNTKFAKPLILGKPVLQPHRNQFVVRQRFASQVDVSNDLSKPVTTHYLPMRRESVPAKPQYMIATSSSRWVPTGKIFAFSTTKVDSEAPNGSNADITNQCESEQALDVSASTLLSTELAIQYHSNAPSSSKLVPKVVPLAVKTATSRQELKLLFHHHIAMLRTTGK
ncbi:hypothetical protein Tco_1260966 [Tanacetum coccineum]